MNFKKELNTASPNSQISIGSLHTQAHTLMDKGSYFEAKAQLLGIVSMMDEHDPLRAEVLIDLAGCMYLTLDLHSFEVYTNKAFQAFKENNLNMSPYQKMTCQLKIGRLFEELGKISLTLELYENISSPNSEKELLRVSEIQAEKLRLSCSYLSLDEVSKNYHILETFRSQNGIKKDVIDHALVKTEMKLFGFQSAKIRFENLTKIQLNLNAEHQQWLYFDFAFSALEFGFESEFDLNYLLQFDYISVGHFEQLVWDLILLSKGNETHAAIHMDRMQGLSLLCKLRLLKVMLRFEKSITIKKQIIEKCRLLLRSLDGKSKRILEGRFLTDLFQSEVVDEGKSSLFDLPLTPTEKRFLDLFKNQTVITTDHVSKIIYQSDASEHILNRIRVTISKINRKMGAYNNFKIRCVENCLKLEGEYHLNGKVG